MNFFAIFLEFSLTRQFGMKRNDNFSFLSLSLFHPILAWNEATIVFFDFFEFSSLFFEFSITSPIGRERKDNFYFFSFSAFSNLFCHEMKPQWYFFYFFLFFCIFLLRVGWERNGTTIFIFSICQPIPTYFGFKRSHNCIF